MHELGLAGSIVQAVRAEAKLRPGARFTNVGLRLGDLSGVDPGALEFCFEVLIRGSELEPLTLEIERRPRRHGCPRCGREFEVVEHRTICPDCGNPRTELIGGTELEIAFLEVEEP